MGGILTRKAHNFLNSVGGVSYPLALTITNPGAETGDATGWTQTVGTGLYAQSGGTYTGFSGTYHFRASATEALNEFYTTADVPSGAQADVDAGLLGLTYTWLFARDSSDFHTTRVEFYDGSAGTGNFLGVRHVAYDSALDPGGASSVNPFVTHTRAYSGVPAGTRSVRLYWWCRRIGGAENSTYIDDVTISLTLPGTHSETIYKDRGVDTSGWTIDTGSGQPPTTNAWHDAGWSGIYGNSQLAYAIHKDITPSAAALAGIAAGTATLFLERTAWNENGDDTSRTFIQCLNASNVVVATVQDAASNTNYATAENVKRGLSVAIPTTTTKIRVNHSFGRVDGTVLDAAIGFVDVYMTW